MEQLLNKAVSLFQEPYDDRDERDSSLPSLRSVAEEMNTTIFRTRKLLITAEYFSTDMSRAVQEMTEEGLSFAEIMDATGLKKASINSYLPYKIWLSTSTRRRSTLTGISCFVDGSKLWMN